MNLYRALEDTHLIVATNIELLSSLRVFTCSYYTRLTAISQHKMCSGCVIEVLAEHIIYERASGLNYLEAFPRLYHALLHRISLP
jgi:hypothetical protein